MTIFADTSWAPMALAVAIYCVFVYLNGGRQE